MDATTIDGSTFVLSDSSGNGVAGTVTYNASTNSATLTPKSALATDSHYTASVVGVKDPFGNTLSIKYSWSFDTDGPTPVVTSVTPASGVTGVATTASVSVVFNHAMDATTITSSTFYLNDSSGNGVPATIAYDSTSNTATLTPSVFLSTSTTYTATVVGGNSGVKATNGRPMASNKTWSFSTSSQASFFPSLWRSTAAPQTISDDTSSVELGVQFYSDVNGSITAIRFYKGSNDTGTHVGNLWGSDGTLLATATFSNETASGWQQVNFSSPVAITANTTYVASYFAPNGGYAADTNYFTNSGVDGSPLHAPSSAASGGNGVYAYNSSSTFPNQSWDDTNYWVDVVFASVPAVAAKSPTGGATGLSATAAITVTFDRAMDPTTINSATFYLTDSSGNVVPATVTYDASTNTATLTPLAPLNLAATYNVFLVGGTTGSRIKDMYGNFLDSTIMWSFTTANS
jgi:hypothetical protein